MHKSDDNRPIVEALLESGEVVADVIMRGDFLADVPVVGTAMKICKAVDSIRDRALAAKLTAFTVNLDGISEFQKSELRKKLAANPKEAKKVGETLFFVLEKITDLDKPGILAKVFIAYIDNVLSAEELRRICQSVDTAFFDDLQMFLENQDIPEKSREQWMQNLSLSGITRPVPGGTWKDIGDNLYYEITSLGYVLKKAFMHVT